METLTFENIYLDLSKHPGRCRFAPNGLGWKPAAGETWTMSKDELINSQWSRAARGYELKLYTKKNTIIQLDGFQSEDFEPIKDQLKSTYKITMEVKEHAIKGWNWGKAEFSKSELLFNVSNRPAFEIPFNEVANSNLAGRAEVALEFADTTSTEAAAKGQKKKKTFAGVDQLMEMRFYIPGAAPVIDKDEDVDAEASGGENGEEAEKEPEDKSAASVFYDMLKKKADIGEVAGDTFAIFTDVLFLTPRGRYDVDMYENSFRLRGKTYDYKIPFENVKKFFLLPKPDDVHHLLVFGLEPALRQGQTKYPFLVLQFLREEELECDLNITEEQLNGKYAGRLQAHYENAAHMVVSAIFKGLTGKKIIQPSKDFISHHHQSGVKCSLKANEGHLFFLDKALLFVPKPAVYVSFDNVQFVTLSRVGGNVSASRTFDVTVTMTQGEHQFNNINREEQSSLENYFKARGVKIKNDLVEDSSLLTAALADALMDDDDDDVAVARADRGSADEDDESVDEDFEADSESDVAEEYDSAHESSGSDSEGGGGGGGGAGDDEDEEMEDVGGSDAGGEPVKKKAKTKK